MSPLGKFILNAMRIGCLCAAGLLVVFLALTLWQKTRLEGLEGLARQDMSFMLILAILAMGALWLARAMRREMDDPGT